MKTLLKITFLITSLLIGGCNSSSTSSRRRTEPSFSSSQNYDYKMVNDRIIFWSNIFSINKENYCVYFFSKTCSHCSSLKSFIIEYALSHENIYFVEASEQTIFLEDVSATIGLSSIEGFGILGYPSLIKISDKIITLNIAGVFEIKNELLN